MTEGASEVQTTATVLSGADRALIGDLEAKSGDALPERRVVETFIAAAIQSEHLNLLVGSGLTTALGLAAKCDSAADMSALLDSGVEELDAIIEKSARHASEVAGRGPTPNIEDRLRVAIAAEAGLRYVADPRANDLRPAIDDALESLRNSIVSIEQAIQASSEWHPNGEPGPAQLLRTFMHSFAGRVPTRDRLHVFTTNYDRAIEWGAELAGLRVVDRFIGSLEPVFRSSRLEVDYHYTPPGSPKEPRHLDGVVRLTKLHGSLDWYWRAATREVRRAPSEFGKAAATPPSDLLIYPSAAKDYETALYPYADLFRDMSAATCRPNSTLVTYGYGFGDDHINRIIRDMLTIPSTHVLVISYADDGGRITRFADDYRRTGQVSLLLGPTFADLDTLTSSWLPRPGSASLIRRQVEINASLGSTAQAGTSA